jgi:hypothetical protein
MVLSIYSVALFAIAYFFSSGSAWMDQRDAAVSLREILAPKWRVDLRPSLGSAPVGQVHGRGREYIGVPKSSLWFIDNNTVVATLVTRDGETNPLLSHHEGSDKALPLRLRAIFLDSASGKVTTTPNWPSESRYAGIVAVHDGKFVAQGGSKLTLYNSDLTVLRELRLPSLTEYDWKANPSPTGKNILFLSSNLKAGSWLWVETDTLQIVRSWEEPRSGWVAIADDKIAMATCEWVYDCEPKVQVRGISTAWETIVLSHRHPHPQFVNNDMLLLSGNPMRLIRIDGRAMSEEDIPEGSYAASSTGGQRFIVPVWAVKGTVAALDIGGHSVLKRILVCDVSSHGCSHVIELEGPKIRDLTQLALSPDGLQLAILNDDAVEIFQLPPLK